MLRKKSIEAARRSLDVGMVKIAEYRPKLFR